MSRNRASRAKAKKSDLSARDIPDPLRRAVRQKCGFGCAVCGLPIFDYEHIVPWATVREHKLENIVLLCPTHHADKTRGRLSQDAVRQAATTPKNIGQAATAGHVLRMAGPEGRIVIGQATFAWDIGVTEGKFAAIRRNNQTIIGLTVEDGWLLLDLILTDAAGAIILRVEKGELKVSTGVWDYNFEGPLLSIRSGRGQLEFEMELADNVVAIHRAKFPLPPSFELVVDRGATAQLFQNGKMVVDFGRMRSTNNLVGMQIDA